MNTLENPVSLVPIKDHQLGEDVQLYRLPNGDNVACFSNTIVVGGHVTADDVVGKGVCLALLCRYWAKVFNECGIKTAFSADNPLNNPSVSKFFAKRTEQCVLMRETSGVAIIAISVKRTTNFKVLMKTEEFDNQKISTAYVYALEIGRIIVNHLASKYINLVYTELRFGIDKDGGVILISPPLDPAVSKANYLGRPSIDRIVSKIDVGARELFEQMIKYMQDIIRDCGVPDEYIGGIKASYRLTHSTIVIVD